MKRLLTLIGLLAGMIPGAMAADSLRVHAPQVPILIDRADNILLEIRLNADRGEHFDNLTLRFSEQTPLAAVKAVRLYYGGTEATDRKGFHFRPLNYLPRGNSRALNPSYSVLQSEVEHPQRSVTLSSGQPMFGGVNFFWVSIETSASAPLDTQLAADIEAIMIEGREYQPERCGDTSPRRLGIGVRHAGDDGAAAYRIPGLVTSNKGTLLGVYDIRHNSAVDLQGAIDIGVSRSTDGGQTWGPMQTAMSFAGYGGLPAAQNGVGDPSILVDSQTGTIWIVAVHAHGMGNGRAWYNSRPGMSDQETAQLVMVRSDDDGLTWSEPINVTPQVKDPSWHFLLQGPGRGITMADGTLVFPMQFIDPERVPHAGVMYSLDHGNTWHTHAPARTDTTEAQVAEVAPGVLMLNMRDNRGGSRAVSTSADLGRSWTEHPSSRHALREPVCMGSLLSVKADENITGRDLLLFSNPDTTSGRNHITIKASTDGGLTWPAEQQVMIDEEDNWGYSCLTLVDRETVGILYESSAAHIVFQRVKLTDLVR